jgi:hypothetical protein
MAKRYDKLFMGLLGGLISAAVGYLLLGLGWSWAQGESLGYFHREVFLGSPLYKDRILSLCTLSIVPLFHLAYRRKMDRFARGTMLLMVILVLTIVVFQMNGE